MFLSWTTSYLGLVDVEDGGDRDPVLSEDGRAGDRLPQPPGPDEGDVVLPLGAQDLADLGQEAIDRVAHPALAELAEVGEVAADLRRVDARVVGDLLRGDPVLAHLLGLGEDLQVPGEARCHTDADAVVERRQPVEGTLQHGRAFCPNLWWSGCSSLQAAPGTGACDTSEEAQERLLASLARSAGSSSR
jgi:hypothetical protein